MSSAEIIAALREVSASHADQIACVYLFGSQARGDARRASDVDIAVLFKACPPATLDGLRFDLAGAFEARLHRPVDMVVLNRAPSDLVHRVLREGIVAVEHDRSARIRFEVRARNDYFDLAPVRARYRAGASTRAA